MNGHVMRDPGFKRQRWYHGFVGWLRAGIAMPRYLVLVLWLCWFVVTVEFVSERL